MSDEYSYADLLRDPAVWDEGGDGGEGGEQALRRIHGAISRTRRRRVATRIATSLAAVVVTIALLAGAVTLVGSTGDVQNFATAQLAATAPGLGGGYAAFEADDAGFRIELNVESLPNPSPDVYEAWLTDGDRIVSIGTFSRGGTATLWSGVSPALLPTIRVTREAVDSDPSSSGRVVLEGPIRLAAEASTTAATTR